jgi:mono/diheme cytochrome c family protein
MKYIIIILGFSFMLACSESPYMQGKRLYTANCQNCHMEDGSGLAKLVPSLQESVLLGSPVISCIIKNGIQDTIRNDQTFLVKEMPAFGKLSATEITNITNYINHSWSKNFKEINITEIESTLKNCP